MAKGNSVINLFEIKYMINATFAFRLDYFLVFFQHYYWFKKSHPDFIDKVDKTNLFPIIIDHLYKECLKNIRPKLKVI